MLFVVLYKYREGNKPPKRKEIKIMTNITIITNDAINNGIFTEEQAMQFIAEYGELPLHTYKEWQRRGYQVKKGEKAKMTSYIWRYKNKAKKDGETDENAVEIEVNKSDKFYQTKAFFFTVEQIEKIEKTA